MKRKHVFSLALDTGIVRDSLGKKEYTADEFKHLVESMNENETYDSTLQVQRLISFNYDIEKLREFYKGN